jgi:tetratricopeptide (TPR) repeat protein
MNKRPFLFTLVLVFSLFIIYGCGKEGGGGGQTAEELIEQGWTKFKAGNFDGASGDFNSALGLDSTAINYDGLLGLGWAELRQSHGGLAENAFLIYLSKTSDTQYQARGGLALAYLAQEKFQDAITTANVVLSGDPAWAFSHDTNINHLDLKLAVVQSYYGIGDYAQCLEAIQTYFDSAFNPGDVNTDQGREALADKIESLYTG